MADAHNETHDTTDSEPIDKSDHTELLNSQDIRKESKMESLHVSDDAPCYNISL